MAMLLITCSNCKTALQLPPAARSVRCALCRAVTHVSQPPPPPLPRLPPPPAAHEQKRPVIVCTNCRTALKHPPAARSVRCHLCHAVTCVSPPPPSPLPRPPPPPPTHGRKKAVIVGISYRCTQHELKGCVNDAKCMRYLLVNRFGFPDASILMLTVELQKKKLILIRFQLNIRKAMYWLVTGCRKGDSLLFHYSGHGSQQRKRNYNEEERDGYDQTLCPLDYETRGMIVDVEINATLVKPLPHRVKLHAIIDCCHSGTMLGLPFLCRMNRHFLGSPQLVR